jgi:hypothetical protein
MARANPSTANANCNNFFPRCQILASNTSIKGQNQGLHVLLVRILIALPIAEFKATCAEAIQNYNITHIPQTHSFRLPINMKIALQ